jgi:hypothetical protein
MSVDLAAFRERYPTVDIPFWLDALLVRNPGSQVLVDPANVHANIETQAWVGAIHHAMGVPWHSTSRMVAQRAAEIAFRFLREPL